MNLLADCYRSAAERLTAAARAVGFVRLPEPIPLRLREDTGTLSSGLAPALAGRGDAGALARCLAGELSLEGTPFDRGEARGVLVLLHISSRWLREAAKTLAAGTAPSPPTVAPGPRDREDLKFLLSYTACRCRTLAGRPTPPAAELPPAVVLRLAAPPGDREREGRLIRAYWALPPGVRRDPALAGAVSRRAGEDYDRFFR
ncbi:MAG: hypothetical protein LUC30_00745 [Clostridiales bacterium]|nr:hypothetical protein [Clostridiales bacterium]